MPEPEPIPVEPIPAPTIGRRYWFVGSFPEEVPDDYLAHNDQEVQVVSLYDEDDNDPRNPMARIQALDGWVGVAYFHELQETAWTN